MRPSAAAEAQSNLPSHLGGRPLPVSQWPKPEQIVSSLPYSLSSAPTPGAPPAEQQLLVPPPPPGGMPSHAAAAASSSRAPPPSSYGGGSSSSSKAPQKPSGQPAAGGQLAPPGSRKRPTDVTERSVAGVSWKDDSLKDWPDDDFRIFVGDLGNETNDDVLAHAFANYPSFQKARVVRNKATQKTMGFGFVSFKDPWDMTKALREMHGKYIGNRPVKVRKSTWKDRGGDNDTIDPQWSVATQDKKTHKKLEANLANKKKKPHVHKKQKGMPW
jgi:hypothetical protein